MFGDLCNIIIVMMTAKFFVSLKEYSNVGPQLFILKNLLHGPMPT